MRSSRVFTCCLALVAALGLPLSSLAQRVDATIAIGTSERIWSDVLQEERRVFISLPAGYERSGERYPVLYLLDAEAHFHYATGIVGNLATVNGRMPEMIVVGITNANRPRDLTPVTENRQMMEDRQGGGADTFLKFLVDELGPWVDERYRTQPYRILVGHSFGGLFAVYAMVTRPEAFQANIAISPSLWWDRGLIEQAQRRLSSLPDGRYFLFLSWGDNEPDNRVPSQALVRWLQAHPTKHVRWASRYYPGESHTSTPIRSFQDGLETLFAGWKVRFKIDDVPQKLDLKEIEAHYAQLSRTYGFTVKPTAEVIGRTAMQMLELGNRQSALELFRRNAREHPSISDVHWELGYALAELGRNKEAAEAYSEARRLSVMEDNPYRNPIAEYREQMERLSRESSIKN